MVRTQIQLTPEQARRVRALGREEGVSMAHVIRRFIDQGLEREGSSLEERYERALELVGAFEDREAAPDVAESHDAYLDGTFD